MTNWLESIIANAAQAENNKKLFNSNTLIFIYGTGSFSQSIKVVLEKRKIEVAGFLDHRIDATSFIGNTPVYTPNDPKLDAQMRKLASIIIGIHNRDTDINNICHNLKNYGYENKIISSIDIYDEFGVELGDKYWLTSRNFYKEYSKEIEFTLELLSDRQSKDVFETILKFRITGDYSILPTPDMDHQYFPPDLPRWKEPLRLVDCGAYNGDTLKSFLQNGYQLNAIAAFEPDAQNFLELSSFVNEHVETVPNTSLFPCGVYSSTTQLTFNAGSGEASAAKAEGNTTIQCVSLDNCIPTFSPTLIKMDIEGTEIDALLGAQRTITKYHPSLAISIYHTPSHLWEIPKLIHKISQDNNMKYTYHLRLHGHNCFDTIFYAIPASN